jgi:hypothetical protein
MQPQAPSPEPRPLTVRNPDTGLLTTDPAECESQQSPELVEGPSPGLQAPGTPE